MCTHAVHIVGNMLSSNIYATLDLLPGPLVQCARFNSSAPTAAFRICTEPYKHLLGVTRSNPNDVNQVNWGSILVTERDHRDQNFAVWPVQNLDQADVILLGNAPQGDAAIWEPDAAEKGTQIARRMVWLISSQLGDTHRGGYNVKSIPL